MEALLDALCTRIRQQTGLDMPFNPGCSEPELAEFEQRIGLRLPGDFRAFLTHANGQRDTHSLSFPPDQLVFLSVAEIMDLWAQLKGYADRTFFDQTEDGDRVRAVLYDPERIPIAYNEIGGAYLFLDGVPGPCGTPMQLVFNPNEAEVRVIAASLSDLFRCYVKLLDAQRMSVTAKPSEYGSGFWFVTGDGQPIEYARFAELLVDCAA